MDAELRSKLQGISAINITPFTENQEIDWPALSGNIDFLISHGMEVIVPCGNTGEFYSLTIDEAKEVVRFTVEHAAGRAKMIIGVGYDSRTAIELARNAEAVGADGIMIHQPVHPFILEEGILNYYQQIARSTTLPVLLYVRNEAVTIDVLREAAKEPNIIGVKYAINNLPSFSKAVQVIGDKLIWICGTAEMWAPYFFAAGATGFTSGMVNVDTKRSIAMLHALQTGKYDSAMSLWNELRPFEELREKKQNGNNVSVVKEAMRQLGLSNGIVRAPISMLQPDEQDQVKQILMKWQLLQ